MLEWLFGALRASDLTDLAICYPFSGEAYEEREREDLRVHARVAHHFGDVLSIKSAASSSGKIPWE